MFYATIFQLHESLTILSTPFDSLSTCLTFLKEFLTTHGEENLLGSGCLSPEVLKHLGVFPT